MNVDQCLEQLLLCRPLPETTVKMICRKAIELFCEESNVQPVKAPVTVVGDIHGQFFDFLEVFRIAGQLPQTQFIFVGDFVDRGYNSVETISYLFCLKIKFPGAITLLRGNHECRSISLTYGFYDEVSKKYGNCNVWKMFNDAFDYLPIGAIVQGKVFCVHGGLSPSFRNIDQVQMLSRKMEIPQNGALCDMMWSDPMDIEQWEASKRGVGWYFGKNPTKKFLHDNNLNLIARAHQLVSQGYFFWFNKQLVTIWSAPNYCYRVGNKAAIMKLDGELQKEFLKFDTTAQSRESQNYNHILPYFL